jgi:hypothetical protein
MRCSRAMADIVGVVGGEDEYPQVSAAVKKSPQRTALRLDLLGAGP